jgi:hypothetical protein
MPSGNGRWTMDGEAYKHAHSFHSPFCFASFTVLSFEIEFSEPRGMRARRVLASKCEDGASSGDVLITFFLFSALFPHSTLAMSVVANLPCRSPLALPLHSLPSLDAPYALDPEGSPQKKQRLSSRSHLPHIEPIHAAMSETGMLSPNSELESLTRSFATACRCGGSPVNGDGTPCCHLTAHTIRMALQFQHALPLPSSIGATGRLMSAPCSCIPLPTPSISSSTVPGTHKRRHRSPPPSTSAISTAAASAGHSSAAAASPNVTMARSGTVRVKKGLRSSPTPPLPPSRSRSPCSSLFVEVADEPNSSPSPEEEREEEDSPNQQDWREEITRTGFMGHFPSTSTASTRSLSPSQLASVPSSSCSHHLPVSHPQLRSQPSYDYNRDADGDSMEDIGAVDQSGVLHEIEAIESEERESELNYLMEKMHSSSRQQQESMPYIL